MCGGGSNNAHLLALIAAASCLPVSSTAALGVPPSLVEPAAFAWFAKQRVERRALDLRSVTGARERCLLGALYEVPSSNSD